MQAGKDQIPKDKVQSQNPGLKDEEKAFDFKSLHFGWFVGHALTVLCCGFFVISNLFFHPLGFFYRAAYLGIVASYGIVLWNSYKPLTNNEFDYKRVLLDENTQYLIVAVFFLLSTRIAVTLIPFFIYSVFHVLEFVNTDLIPNLAPHQTKMQSTINDIITKYHDKSMALVAKIEVCGVMARLVLGLFVFQSSVLSVLVYTQFLRMRYYMSGYTREFLNELGTKTDRALTPPTAHPKIPPAVINAYATLKEKLNLGAQPIPATTAKKTL